MIDLHCHILPDCDDGSPDLTTSLKLANVAVEQNIDQILVTPHHMDGQYLNHKPDVIKRVSAFQKELGAAGIPLKIYPGQEVHLNGNLMQAVQNDDILYADKNHHYMMLELPHFGIPRYTGQMIFDLQAKGITPVIVHPERNMGFRKYPNKLYEYVSRGCLTQLTASSYVGIFGKKIQKFTNQIIDAHLGFTFASDAHNLAGRNFKMQQAYQRLNQKKGAGMVKEYQDNAAKILHGKSVDRSKIRKISQKNWILNILKKL